MFWTPAENLTPNCVRIDNNPKNDPTAATRFA